MRKKNLVGLIKKARRWIAQQNEIYQKTKVNIMCRCLVADKPISNAGIQRGYVISVVEDDHVFSDSEILNNYIVDIPGKSVQSAGDLLRPLTRPAVPGEPNYEAPDEPDRIVQIGVRAFYFAFDESQLAALENYRGISLLPADAEITVKTTQQGGIFKFSE